MLVKLVVRNKLVLLYGLSVAFLLLLLNWLELRFLVIHHSFEVYIGAVAIIFTAFGVWLALKLIKPKVQTVVVEKEVYINEVTEKGTINPNPGFIINEKEITALGLSKRELEVLELMAEGLSNKEIASHLYLSLNTIKTHSSKLFEKMDVKRRTQAIEKAKRSGVIK